MVDEKRSVSYRLQYTRQAFMQLQTKFLRYSWNNRQDLKGALLAYALSILLLSDNLQGDNFINLIQIILL